MGKNRQTLPNNRKTGNVTQRVTLRYAQVKTPTGATNVFTLRGNGLFDPDATGAGSQPTGFDEYMAIYKNFRVIGSKCTAVMSSGSTTFGSGTSLIAVRWDDNSGAVPASSSDVLAQRNSVYSFNTGIGAPVSRVTAQCRTDKATRLSPSSPDLMGSASADPTVQWHWHVTVNSIDASSTPSGRLYVIVEYDVEFFGMKTLLLS
jgi:hypothetical protein